MAKLSLSGAIKNRKRIRIVTALAVMLLLFFGISMIVSRNPKGTRAALTVLGDTCTYTFGSGYTSANFDSAQCSGKNVIVNGGGNTINGYLIVSGSLRLKNLTVQNYGIVTHGSLIAVNDFSTTYPNPLTASGQAKKVDLEIDNDLILDSGGKIDVSGKGYPGGVSGDDIGQDGYGFGRSAGLPTSSPTTGAGYGGNGGGYTSVYGLSYPADYNSSIFDLSQFYFGSSSGGSHIHYDGRDSEWVDGAAGGGRIHLKIGNGFYIKDSSSYILANGANAEDSALHHDGGHCRAASGGGAGGTIWIESPFASTTGLAYTVAGGLGSVPGGIGSSAVEETWMINNLMAIGGTGEGGCDDSPTYGGGGGRIVVKKIVSQPVTIKKTLEPLYRADALDTGDSDHDTYLYDNFNPYALQRNDRIKVNLEVTNLVQGTLTLTDEMLRVPYSADGTAYCAYSEPSFQDLNNDIIPMSLPVAPNYELVWQYLVLAGETSKEFSYECIVQ